LEYSVKSEISKLTNLIMGQKDIDVLKIWHKTEIYHLEKTACIHGVNLITFK
jgi:hypothetical protein